MALVAPRPLPSLLDKPVDVRAVNFIEAGLSSSCDHPLTARSWDLQATRSNRSSSRVPFLARRRRPVLISRQTDSAVTYIRLAALLHSPDMEPVVRQLYVGAVKLVRLVYELPGLDLHDLHSLRTKFLLFIHDLVRALQSSGVRPCTAVPDVLKHAL